MIFEKPDGFWPSRRFVSGALSVSCDPMRGAEIAKEKCQVEKMDKGRAEIDRGKEREIIKRSTANKKGDREACAGKGHVRPAGSGGRKQEVSRWKSIWHSKA